MSTVDNIHQHWNNNIPFKKRTLINKAILAIEKQIYDFQSTKVFYDLLLFWKPRSTVMLNYKQLGEHESGAGLVTRRGQNSKGAARNIRRSNEKKPFRIIKFDLYGALIACFEISGDDR